ncbi:MAG: 30S ribosomal protein S6 [Chloroflexi bacterium CG23_combo_of_CG06-09_8_20_14_all_45_10]|nr:MAG: 30S ribosomal protein S6 [Chloroflexi bacterium CG23_combo_of_CG06-09_8_20_14_all_45_10]
MNLAMRNYELVIVISPEVDGEELPKVVEKVNRFISDRNGIVEETEQWGRRKLAYPIKKFMEGDYILTRFKLEPELVKALEADLAASEEVLRQLIVKVGD